MLKHYALQTQTAFHDKQYRFNNDTQEKCS